jgi:hypothetical protein
MTKQNDSRSRNRIVAAVVVAGMLGVVLLSSLKLAGRATGAEGGEAGGCGGQPGEAPGNLKSELTDANLPLHQNLGLLPSPGPGKALHLSAQRIKPGGSLTFDVNQDATRAIMALDAQGGDALTITDDEITPPQGSTPSLHRFKIAVASGATPGSKLTVRSMAVWPSRDDPNWAFSFDVQIATP